MVSFETLKNRLNEIYRCNAILEGYQNNLLRNSEFSPDNGKALEDARNTVIMLAKEMLNAISAITGRDYNATALTQPLDIAYDLIKSEHFFNVREVVDGLLAVYEKHFTSLVNKFNISPLDKIRFYKMQFV